MITKTRNILDTLIEEGIINSFTFGYDELEDPDCYLSLTEDMLSYSLLRSMYILSTCKGSYIMPIDSLKRDGIREKISDGNHTVFISEDDAPTIDAIRVVKSNLIPYGWCFIKDIEELKEAYCTVEENTIRFYAK